MSIVMRTLSSKQGLIDMCNYIDSLSPLAAMNMIEIGSFSGDSTEIFAQRFKKIYAIDPWKNGIGDITDKVDMFEVYQQFIKKIKPYNNIEVIKDFSYNAYGRFEDKSIDLVYIDGLHTYDSVAKDIKLFLSKIKDKGFICGHDYRNKFPGVIRAVFEQLTKPDKVFKDSSWVVRTK